MAAVRVRRGQPAKSVRDTLKLLNLTGLNSCILCTPEDKGMLRTAKDYLTYGQINTEQLSRLLASSDKDGADDPDQKAKELVDGDLELKNSLKGPYRLSPPSKGYKDSRRPYRRGGSLGHRGQEINHLLKRMV